MRPIDHLDVVDFPASPDTITRVTIALVGFTGSYNDLRWQEMAEAWWRRCVDAADWSGATRVVFDLRGEQGRNFLDDAGTYDVVILFAIFNPPADSVDFQRSRGRQRGQKSLAVNHSRDAWASRLSNTSAKYVFVFRRDDSVDGEWLGEIEHFTKLPDSPGVFGVTIYACNSSNQRA